MGATRSQAGLTLIEIMVTLAIVSILVVAAMAVTVRMGRIERAVVAGPDHRAARRERIADVLAMDLTHAERYGQLANEPGFVLITRACLEPGSLELSHLPVTVTYTIFQAAGQPWLARAQRSAGRQPVRELLCQGVRDLFLTVQVEQPAAAGRTRPVPETVNVVVDFGGPEELELYSFGTR